MRFETYTLAELATIKYGKNQKKVQSPTGTIPIYGTGGLMGYASKALYDKPSVLIGRKGTIGKVKYVERPFWTVDTLFYTIVNTDIVLPRYLYYVMSLLDLNAYNEGTTIPSLRTETLNRLQFAIPPLDDQAKILSVVLPLENKIVVNDEINKNLEQQAEIIFAEKFLSQDTLPIGWARTTIGNVSEMNAGGDKPEKVAKYRTTELRYPIYSNGISDEGLYGFTDEYKISVESVTVSARGTIGFVCLRHIPYTPIVRLVTLVPNTKVVSAKYLYLWLKSIHIQGTGTTQQQLTVPNFRKTEIIIPPEPDMRAFTEIVTPIFQKIWINQEENANLAQIRDTLLPKLLSGELDVSRLSGAV